MCRLHDQGDGIDIQQLRYFVEVTKEKAREGCKKLFVSQPALSKMIGKLESDLGIKLLTGIKGKLN